MTKIVVSGMGVISPLGEGLNTNLEGLRTAGSVLTHLENFETAYAHNRYYGEIKKSNKQLELELNIQDKGVSRTSLLAIKALKEALADSQLSEKYWQASDTAFVLGTTVGGLSHTKDFLSDSISDENPSDFVNSYSCGSVSIFIQKHFGLTGISNTINSACSSGANAIEYGANLIKHGFAKRAIVGGADGLSKYTINGFNALHILSPDYCRPFDANRQGLNLGEGAAFLILEKEGDRVVKNNYAYLAGSANTNDSYHASAISPEGNGPYLAMKNALESATLYPENIDYINAHGTATENNDLTESRAMIRLFNKVPDFQSTKSITGHTLGAAGAIESVFSILALHNQEVYPSLHFKNPIPDTGLTPTRALAKKSMKHVMTNSFGFGGNCTSLIFSKT